MRKFLILIIFATSLLTVSTVNAQINKAYFYYTGRGFLIDNQYKEAIETLNVLLKVDPEAYEAYFYRGIAKYNLDDLLGAEADFTTAITKNPVYTMAYHYRAITHSGLGNYNDALLDFQDAIDLRPDLPSPYYSRGVTYFLSQQFKKAIDDFDQFIRQEPRVVDAYIVRGLSYLHLHDTIKAFENYNTAIRTNREAPEGYYRRGSLYMAQKQYDKSLEDMNMSIKSDSTYVPAYFDRAVVYSNTNRPMDALSDFDKVLELDPINSLVYFNRAIVRANIGDYNRALEDYNMVAQYSPSNVLVYYNRANLYTHLGDLNAAIKDYTKAIELYPDFAAAYLNRSHLRYLLRDTKGSNADKNIAERKISEYRSKLSDSTFSIYADTSRRFNQLLSFETKVSGGGVDRIVERDENITMMPLFRFSLIEPDSLAQQKPNRYYMPALERFKSEFNSVYFALSTDNSNIPADSIWVYDKHLAESLNRGDGDWHDMFMRGITQSSIKQYTSSINIYSDAIDKNPTNPFLYLNRSTTRSEMIDFISSIDNSYQRITIENDRSNRLKNTSSRTYNYDEAISDLNKAIKLLPDFAHFYYNRANLEALSGRLPEAYEDYSRAIKLHPSFAEAYFNRGLVQIYLKDTRKGCLDMSKAGELGIKEAYTILKEYTYAENQ